MATLKERIREVGVKMAIGAPGREVFKEFMTEALLLTAAGSLAGLVVGVGFSKIITSVDRRAAAHRSEELRLGVPARRVFGFVFALYPACKAARLSPMEALRYE